MIPLLRKKAAKSRMRLAAKILFHCTLGGDGSGRRSVLLLCGVSQAMMSCFLLRLQLFRKSMNFCSVRVKLRARRVMR